MQEREVIELGTQASPLPLPYNSAAIIFYIFHLNPHALAMAGEGGGVQGIDSSSEG